MESALIPQLPPAGALLEGRTDAIRRMDDEHGRVAAARELEVVFFTQLIEAMRRTVPENSLLPRSPTRDVYDGLFDRELATFLAASDPVGLIARLGYAEGEDSASPCDREGARVPAAGTAEATHTGRPCEGRLVSPVPSTAGLQVLGAAVSSTAAESVSPPVEGAVSSAYGPRRDPISGGCSIHRGIDFAAPAGTPIRAVAAGRVVASGWAGPAGNRVMIEHDAGYRTVYAHAGRAAVDVADRVVAGQVIATVGSSGRTTGPHLHFEVHRNQVSLDPAREVLTADAVRRGAAAGEA